MAPKLKDIAARAHLSTAAVSLALNGKTGVSKETVQRVRRIAKELNYTAARDAETRQRTVRFVQIQKPESIVDPIYNIFLTDYLKGLSRSARAGGYKLEMSAFPEGELAEVVDSLVEDRPAGAVVLGAGLMPADVMMFTSSPVPLVFIDVCYEFIGLDFVDMNNEDSVYQIVTHLREQGHEKVGLFQCARYSPNFTRRESGFRRAVEQFGMGFSEQHRFVVSSQREEAVRQVRNGIRRARSLPTAVFCVNDTIAYNCMQAFKEEGIRVPEDISVVGFDNLPAGRLMEPALTTVDISKQLIGERAFSLLTERIRLGHEKPAEKILITGTLVKRDSVRSLR